MFPIKHAKKPTREQRKLIEQWGLDAHNWMVVKDTSTEMVIQHRHSERTTRTIPKELRWADDDKDARTVKVLGIAKPTIHKGD